MPRYLVESVCTYRMVYHVEAPSAAQAKQAVQLNQVPEEFGQQYLGEQVLAVYPVTPLEVVNTFDELHPYLKSWSSDRKWDQVHVIPPDISK